MGKFSSPESAQSRSAQPDRSRPLTERRRMAGTCPAASAQNSTARQTGQGSKFAWRTWVLVWQLGRLSWHTVRLSIRLVKGVIRGMRRYPVLGLLIAWAILVGMAIAATTTIMSPEASVNLKAAAPASPVPSSGLHQTQFPQTQSPSATGLPTPALTAEADPLRPAIVRARPAAAHSPSAAVSIILISCSAGCLFLSRCLKPRAALSSRRPDLAGPARSRLEPARPATPAFLPVLPPAIPVPQPAAPEPNPELDDSFDLALPAQLEAPVYDGPLLAADETDSEPLDPEDGLDNGEPVDATVVPEAQDHPLDWTEPSLADSLDLRQRRSLSYWLEGFG